MTIIIFNHNVSDPMAMVDHYDRKKAPLGPTVIVLFGFYFLVHKHKRPPERK